LTKGFEQTGTCRHGGLVAGKSRLHSRWAILLREADCMCTDVNKGS
jgi:hypothetical protein